MYIGHGRLCVCVSVARRILKLMHGPGYKLGEWEGCPLVVQYWADLQSVHGFRCYDNVASNAKCERVLVLAQCPAVVHDSSRCHCFNTLFFSGMYALHHPAL